MPYILVLYYSRHGSTKELAQHIKRGIMQHDGLEVRLRTVPEVSANCEATAKSVPDEGAPYVSLDDLEHCASLALGSPTRFGNMAAPMKYFWDTTTQLWLHGNLIGKPACVFSSSSSMHGGQESTLLSMMIPLLHHGMVLLGQPYSDYELSSTVTGGTPYGVTHVTGINNQVELSDDEKSLARKMGARLAALTLKLQG
jgi:NAD(P)H dehydrogenase (quinone)